MKQSRLMKQYFFVDESGDPTFYDKNGNLIVGNEGCSKILLIGFIQTEQPHEIREAFLNLKNEISQDKYLTGVPSIKKTLRAFHAKDDCPEVRQAVFKNILDLDFKAQFVVARKIERIFRNRFQHDENQFYDYLVSKLFENVLHKNQENFIYFAKRGSRKRQKPLEQALKVGVKAFEEKWNVKVETQYAVQSQSPVGEPCLQLTDYMNWAIYRVFTKSEMRYFTYVKEKVSLVWDIYDAKKYPKNYYNKKNPLKIEKISPL